MSIRNFTFRDYQTEMSAKIDQAWSNGACNVCAVLPTGAGKTVIFANKTAEYNGFSMAIAHRQELVGQISLALAKFNVEHEILAPRGVINFIQSQHLQALGRSYYKPGARKYVAGVATLIRRRDKLAHILPKIGRWTIDECFPAGTLIDGIPIEKIKIGDSVNSYNERTGKIEKQVVTRLFKNLAPGEFIRIQSGHHVLTCTKDHPILTQGGWKNAREITTNDYLYLVRQENRGDNGKSKISLEKNKKNLLQSPMRLCFQENEDKEKSTSTKTLYNLRKFNGFKRLQTNIIQSIRAGLLFKNLFRCLSFKNILGNNEQNQQKICIRKDEEKQSHEKKGNQAESFLYSEENKAQACYSGRQWQTGNRSREKVIRIIRGIRIFKPINSYYRHTLTLSTSLQNRLRQFSIENSNRSRWLKSLFNKKTGAGRQKNSFLTWSRVDSVSILKSGDIGQSSDGCVYNLEVNSTHTYIANGIVVHNCHHVLTGNQWGTAAELFPNALGLGVTATPVRADGNGLGRHHDGVFDQLIVGPSMRDLINQGYLCDYKIYAPPSNIDWSDVPIGPSGDYVQKQLNAKFVKTKIIGDIVKHYKKYAEGKTGVTFVPSVASALEVAKLYNDNGVPAMAVSAKTSDELRAVAIERLKRRELLQLVNVDLFGEGFDLPAIECVSMARPTESYSLFVQQFGRSLRPLPGKEYAIIIDHVGNVMRHGLPDRERVWSLDRRERNGKAKKDPDLIPTKTCISCTAVYEAIYKKCPFCGYVDTPADRSDPEFVDGDLVELDASTLARMRGEIDRIDAPAHVIKNRMENAGAAQVVVNSATKNHLIRQQAQRDLRAAIAQWAGYHKAAGRDDSEIYKRFYWKFAIDIMTAQTLGRAEAEALTQKIIFNYGDL